MTNEKNSTSKKDPNPLIDKKEFKRRVLDPCVQGNPETIKADDLTARAIIPSNTAPARSFAYVGDEIPKVYIDKCVGCMKCIVACPDIAICSRTLSAKDLEAKLEKIKDPTIRQRIRSQFVVTTKYSKVLEKKGKESGLFSVWIDPDRGKGCGICVEVCGKNEALAMQTKTHGILNDYRQKVEFIKKHLDASPIYYINDRLAVDMFMDECSRINCGGAGQCMGCGETTVIHMTLTATANKYGKNMVIVASTGCNTVYSSNYPYNVFNVPWTSSLFENAPAVALGVRMRLDQQQKEDTRIWVIGGDGAMWDIGFQSLSRLLMSQKDINVLVLDTQAYSNTGGQASTASFHGQNAKMSAVGTAIPGKIEERKELGLIAMQHENVYVAQVSPAYMNHFLQATQEALAFPGPSILIAYSVCVTEHKVASNLSIDRARAAVDSRAFPLFTFDPRKGERFSECLRLKDNPALQKDWVIDSQSGEAHDFVWFARGEGRFAKHFDKNGKPSDTLLEAQAVRLKSWHRLQELAGV